MLQQTALRVQASEFSPIILVGSEEQRFHVKGQLAAVHASVEAILLEPARRNTSAAVALAAAWASQHYGDDELLLVLPSDHLVGDAQSFHEAMRRGIPHAADGSIVLFGVTPTEPNTQYGYIEVDPRPSQDSTAYPVVRFTEKPTLEVAQEYIRHGNMYWNGGMFLARTRTFLDEFHEFLPGSLEAIERSLALAEKDGVFVWPEGDQFTQAQNISIDHAVLEKTSRSVVVPLSAGWSDIGSWDSVWRLGPSDEHGNVIVGDVIAIDTNDSLLRNQSNTLIATLGVSELAVVALRDAILIASLDRAGDVTRVMAAAEAEGRESAVSTSKVPQSWGSSEVLAGGAGFEIRQLVIEAGSEFSPEDDGRYSHVWIVLRGDAVVRFDHRSRVVKQHESIQIPAGTDHSLKNDTDSDLELIEVRTTSHGGEAPGSRPKRGEGA